MSDLLGRGAATWPLLLGLAAACEAPVERAPRSQLQAAIVAGTEDSQDPAVVGIGVRRVGCDSLLAVHCTGTLIAPRVVLTAAHCAGAPAMADNLEVLFGRDAADPTAVVLRVSEVHLHPGYQDEGDPADLAVLILEQRAPAAPLPINTSPLDGSWVQRRVRLVGFGQSQPSGAPPGTKRSGTATIDEVKSARLRILPAPSLSCHGDSGGPVLGPGRSGEVLLGVTATGDPGCAAYGLNVRVDAFADDFILPWIAKTPAAAPPPTAGLLPEAPLCTAPCEKDIDCPSGLRCRLSPTSDGLAARCVVPGLLAGELLAACTSDAECSDRCVRIGADRSAACRCYRSCAESTETAAGQGCSMHRSAEHAAGGPIRTVAVLSFLLLVLGALRRISPWHFCSYQMNLGDSHHEHRRKL